MKPFARLWFIPLLMVPPSLAAAAGKYSWFSDPLSMADTPPLRSSAFGLNVYRSTPEAASEAGSATEQKLSLYGDYPARYPTRGDTYDSSRRFSNFGVRWQHRVSATDRFSVSAEQGDSWLLRSSTTIPDALGTRATVSWTRELSWAWKPSISGGVFLGDESTRDDSLRSAGRRYYGFAVGGELRGWQSHTPYVSFRMERSLYDVSGGTDDVGASTFSHSPEDSSRVAAGWRWQATRGLSLQAEASYGFNNNGSDFSPVDRERSRIIFGTRFDFR